MRKLKSQVIGMMKRLKTIKRIIINSFIRNKANQTIAFLLVLVILIPLVVPGNSTVTIKDVPYPYVIAHGGGEIDGYETTNSREAVENAIKNGFQDIEMDLALSSDSKVIAVHDWESQCRSYFSTETTDRVTAEAFSKLLIFGQFHTLTFDDIAHILRKNRGIRLITDTKEDNYAILRNIALNYPDVIDQIYPQIYSYEEYAAVKALGYKRMILTLYKMGTIDTDALLAFVTSNKCVHAVTVSQALDNSDFCTALTRAGVAVYTHTVNDFESALSNKSKGFAGIYSDDLIPADFDGFNAAYYPAQIVGGVAKKLSDGQFDDGYLHFNIKSADTAAQTEYVKFMVDDRYVRVIDNIGNQYYSYPMNADGRLYPKDIKDGKHNIKIEVYSQDGKLIGSRSDYYIWKSKILNRMVDSVCEYKLDRMKEIRPFKEIMTGVSDDVYDILSRSYITKSWAYVYYNNGKAGQFKADDNDLDVRTYGSHTMLPLAVTCNTLGFESVTMDAQSQLWITYDGTTSTVMANGSMINVQGKMQDLSVPLMLFNNRCYAPVDIFSKLTGRQAIDADGIVIILPRDITADEKLKGTLTKAAANLFMDK